MQHTCANNLTCDVTLRALVGKGLALAVVDEPQTRIRHDDDVAGVRIRVEQRALKNLVPECRAVPCHTMTCSVTCVNC